MTEKDFLRAEIEFVPAVKATDVGLDRSLVGAYGQDDKVCAYTALTAEMKAKSRNTGGYNSADKKRIVPFKYWLKFRFYPSALYRGLCKTQEMWMSQSAEAFSVPVGGCQCGV